jgi:hypothetical protein
MSILDINLNDAEELKILPDNEEALLRVSRADVTPNKSDATRSNLALTFDSPDDPMVDDIRVWLPIPNAAGKLEDPKRYTKQLNRIKGFFDALGVDGDNLDTDDLLGKECWALIAEEEGLDGQPQNGIRRFIIRK